MSILTDDHPLVRELRAEAARHFEAHPDAPAYVRIRDTEEARAVRSPRSPDGIRVLLWIPPRVWPDGRDADWDSNGAP